VVVALLNLTNQIPMVESYLSQFLSHQLLNSSILSLNLNLSCFFERSKCGYYFQYPICSFRVDIQRIEERDEVLKIISEHRHYTPILLTDLLYFTNYLLQFVFPTLQLKIQKQMQQMIRSLIPHLNQRLFDSFISRSQDCIHYC
jgi:hypothetical protein